MWAIVENYLFYSLNHKQETMATRKKKTIIAGVTREAADEAFATFAKADAQCNKINAEIELQCAKIREKWADKLTTLHSLK